MPDGNIAQLSISVRRIAGVLLLILPACWLHLSAQQRRIDSLLNILDSGRDDTVKVKNLIALANTYSSMENADALKYAGQALALSKRLENVRWQASSHYCTANIHARQYCYDAGKAMDGYFSALRLADKTHNEKLRAKCYQGIARIYWRMDDKGSAIKNYQNAIDVYQRLGDTEGLAGVYNNMGIMLSDTSAIRYFRLSIECREKIGDKKGAVIPYENLGGLYVEVKNFSEAARCYQSALRINEELGNKTGIKENVYRMGLLYAAQGLHQKALKTFLDNISDGRYFDDLFRVQTYMAVHEVYAATNRHDMGISYLRKALPIARGLNYKDYISSILDDLVKAEKITGLWKEAFAHRELYNLYKDSLSGGGNKERITRIQMQYEKEKSEMMAMAEREKAEARLQAELMEKRFQRNTLVGGFAMMLLLAGVSYRSYRIKRRDNRTIALQKSVLEEKNRDITDSIRYAKRIQDAKLPPLPVIAGYLPQSFVLFKPKDIVSGDFYYIRETGSRLVLAAADCTGHGVPGAIMSMIGFEQLDAAVSSDADPSGILMRVNNGVRRSLRQNDTEDSTRDGMDMAICTIDLRTREVIYAGANRPLWLIRHGSGDIEEIKATKKAIGGFTELTQIFDRHVLQLQKGDTFYIFSDGYADTFSGTTGKKLTTKRFREILFSIKDQDMSEQKTHLEAHIESWRSGTEQVDDILVIGVRLT
jgi:serine phosphatase RsbU (regulator of sigma subunit)